MRNLEGYARLAAKIPHAAELSLACVLGTEETDGAPEQSVRRLGERLGVRHVRFRPLLPLGRAAKLTEPMRCEGFAWRFSPEDALQRPFYPIATCGIGQNLFIHPDGGSFPCYALCDEGESLGNALSQGLENLLVSPAFMRLSACTVDTVEPCAKCEYRYLCGGACQAWNQQHDPCGPLRQRAERLVDTVRRYILG